MPSDSGKPSSKPAAAPGPGSRLSPVEPGTRPELAALEARIRGARGRISPLYTMLLNSAPVASGWEQLLTAIRQQTSVPPALRELVILRIAVLNGADFEFQMHVPHALKAGITQETIDSLKNKTVKLEGVEALVLQYTDAMTRDIQVDDGLFHRLKEAFEAKTLVELTATIAAYNMVSRFLVALQIR
jgi:AhpD family alkylhydroperoxidase